MSEIKVEIYKVCRSSRPTDRPGAQPSASHYGDLCPSSGDGTHRERERAESHRPFFPPFEMTREEKILPPVTTKKRVFDETFFLFVFHPVVYGFFPSTCGTGVARLIIIETDGRTGRVVAIDGIDRQVNRLNYSRGDCTRRKETTERVWASSITVYFFFSTFLFGSHIRWSPNVFRQTSQFEEEEKKNVETREFFFFRLYYLCN